MSECSAASSLFASVAPNAMAATLQLLARARPDLADRSGVAVWPVPAMFPALLSRAVDLLQQSICGLYLDGSDAKAAQLAEVRGTLIQLSSTGGDLGEDHCLEFLHDHPDVRSRASELGNSLPFHAFLRGLLAVDDPIEFVGAILRNEEGSPAEIEALLDCEFIKYGRYFKIHHAEEPNHARLAMTIAEILYGDPDWRNRAIQGIRRHDQLYSNSGITPAGK